jgi:hypothetical protein
VTLGSSAAGIFHLKAATIECKTRDNLVGIHSCFRDHRQRVFGLGLIDLAAETAADRTSRAFESVRKELRSNKRIMRIYSADVLL